MTKIIEKWKSAEVIIIGVGFEATDEAVLHWNKMPRAKVKDNTALAPTAVSRSLQSYCGQNQKIKNENCAQKL
jgi:DNA-binding transcriptional regulator LsrR (DeoR family)